MSELIEAIKNTRKEASYIAMKALTDSFGKSEAEIRDKISEETKTHPNLFPNGWYDPPTHGIAVLFDEKPFKRLAFSTLRAPENWPGKNLFLNKKSVGLIYLSPIDMTTKMIGDIGFTVYNGDDPEIKEHLRDCYRAIRSITEQVQVGMKFSELCSIAKQTFLEKSKKQNIITFTSRLARTDIINLGHTVPGTFEHNFDFGNSFEEVKENIRSKRIYINSDEEFEIPETCALTIESRLMDIEKEYLPNVFFHFIVTFYNGKKEILENFDGVFNLLNMNYIKQ